MKKFFGIFLAAVSALVLLPGCGGGGDSEEATRMTVEQFAAGSKCFELRTGNGTVFVEPTYGQSPYPLNKPTVDGEGNVWNGKYGIQGTVQHGTENSPHDATFNYSVMNGDDGLPLKGVLIITLTDQPNETDPICEFLNIEGAVVENNNDNNGGGGDGGDDGDDDVVLQAVQIDLFFDTGMFQVVDGAGGYLYVYPN